MACLRDVGLLAFFVVVCLVGRTVCQEATVEADVPFEDMVPAVGRPPAEEYERNMEAFGVDFSPALFGKIGSLVRSSFIGPTSSLTDPKIDSFLENYFDALDDSSTDFIQQNFSGDARAFYTRVNETEEVVSWAASGKRVIVERAQEWFDSRGAVLSPTIYTVVTYKSPLLVVNVEIPTEERPNATGTHVFVFRGERVCVLGLFIDANGDLPLTAPQPVVDIVEQYFNDIDNKEMTAINEHFDPNITLSFFMDWPDNGLGMKLFTNTIEGYRLVTQLGYEQRGEVPTSSSFSILHYRYPLVVVFGEMEQPVGSGIVKEDALSVWKLSRGEGDVFTVVNQAIALSINDESLIETLRKWALNG